VEGCQAHNFQMEVQILLDSFASNFDQVANLQFSLLLSMGWKIGNQ